jgi:hypothetical protein
LLTSSHRLEKMVASKSENKTTELKQNPSYSSHESMK